MTEPQDETLENQTEQPIQPDPPSEPSESQIPEGLGADEENVDVDGNEPIPPQFQSPYFPNGVFEDARAPEKNVIRYDPFEAQADGEEGQEKAPNRKTRVIIGAIMLILIAAVIVALVTGRLVIPF